MKRVTGIGGIFFKTQDQKGMRDWYREHLGVEVGDDSSAMFVWRDNDDPEQQGMTVWALFPADTDYFGSGPAPFMINYRVEDLHAVLAQLREEGVQVDDKVEDLEYGKFGWITDPDGNRIELWEPPKDQ